MSMGVSFSVIKYRSLVDGSGAGSNSSSTVLSWTRMSGRVSLSHSRVTAGTGLASASTQMSV